MCISWRRGSRGSKSKVGCVSVGMCENESFKSKQWQNGDYLCPFFRFHNVFIKALLGLDWNEKCQ